MTTTISGTSGISTSSVTATGTVDAATIEGNTVTQDTVAMPRMVLSTAQATTSGTSIDFTSIPSWVKKITVMLNGVSTNGVSNLLVQLGDSDGIETTGYVSVSSSSTSSANSTAGFLIYPITAATTSSGSMIISGFGSNIWVEQGNITGATFTSSSSGNKTLSGTLDRLRLTTVNGTDTFDAGSVNIMYEG